MKVAAVIPARMASHRFPGKPLLELHGLPMVEHVRRRTLLCRRFSEVVVATCDAEIAAVVKRYGGRCIMTSPDHPAATDRVAEAAGKIDCTHVVNVQGDEILILPNDLECLVRAMEAEPLAPAWNAVARIDEERQLSDRSIVKCALSASDRILYCARDFSYLAGKLDTHFRPLAKVLGILGYRKDFLESYGSFKRTPLEAAESIDQSRILEHDKILKAIEFSKGYGGINEPREVQMVKRCLREDSLQQAVLQEVLSA